MAFLNMGSAGIGCRGVKVQAGRRSRGQSPVQNCGGDAPNATDVAQEGCGAKNTKRRGGGWCCWGGLNSRPLPYQGSALPLSYNSAVGGLLRGSSEGGKRGRAKNSHPVGGFFISGHRAAVWAAVRAGIPPPHPDPSAGAEPSRTARQSLDRIGGLG